MFPLSLLLLLLLSKERRFSAAAIFFPLLFVTSSGFSWRISNSPPAASPACAKRRFGFDCVSTSQSASPFFTCTSSGIRSESRDPNRTLSIGAIFTLRVACGTSDCETDIMGTSALFSTKTVCFSTLLESDGASVVSDEVIVLPVVALMVRGTSGGSRPTTLPWDRVCRCTRGCSPCCCCVAATGIVSTIGMGPGLSLRPLLESASLVDRMTGCAWISWANSWMWLGIVGTPIDRARERWAPVWLFSFGLVTRALFGTCAPFWELADEAASCLMADFICFSGLYGSTYGSPVMNGWYRACRGVQRVSGSSCRTPSKKLTSACRVCISKSRWQSA